jgi:hypothetical protein
MAWMEMEEKLFRRLERQIVDKHLQNGFADAEKKDQEGFLAFSQDLQNRRKTRAGIALENHLEEIFRMHSISYGRNSRTEKQYKPNFLFPGVTAYHQTTFPSQLLTMLGVRTTCSNKWQRILSEAARIPEKHLFTIEPGLSEVYTNEMRKNRLQLVLPESLHATFRESQKEWLMNLNEFINTVKNRESKSRHFGG